MHGRRGARLRALLLVTAAGLLAGACGASEAAAPPPPTGTIGGVGDLPAVLTPATTDPEPGDTTTSVAVTSRDRPPDTVGPAGTTVGEEVDGNRVLLIGDSLMASVSRRYGGQMCAALVPLGWATEVDAETGRFIDFGDRVLDKRLRPAQGIDWDAVVIFLGNNYGSNPDVYRAALADLVDRTAPRPTILLTVTEFEPAQRQVNDIIREVAATSPHVRVVDWAALAAANPSFQGDDGLHLTESGRERLAYEVAAVLGGAPAGTPGGECLSTSFSDDSAGSPVTRSPSSGNRTTTTVKATAATSTTVKPGSATSTTVRAGTTLPDTTAAATTTTPVTPPPTVQATTTQPNTQPTPPPTTTQVTPPAADDGSGGNGGP
jgi:hypothetical protein